MLNFMLYSLYNPPLERFPQFRPFALQRSMYQSDDPRAKLNFERPWYLVDPR